VARRYNTAGREAQIKRLASCEARVLVNKKTQKLDPLGTFGTGIATTPVWQTFFGYFFSKK
jgi:hypothetical protein